MFIVHVFINRNSWNVTLDDRRYILIFVAFNWGDILPRTTIPSLYSHSLLVKFKVLRLSCYWSILGPLCLLRWGQGPKIYLGLRPHNSPLKLQFSLPIQEEKWGFDVKKKSHMFPWFLHVRVLFHVSYNCSWRFETRDASLNAPGSALFPISYGEK